MFNDDAIGLLHQTSRGIPRAVNNLALQALIAAFVEGKGMVDEAAVRTAVNEVTSTATGNGTVCSVLDRHGVRMT